jgi:hypothetical protein
MKLLLLTEIDRPRTSRAAQVSIVNGSWMRSWLAGSLSLVLVLCGLFAERGSSAFGGGDAIGSLPLVPQVPAGGSSSSQYAPPSFTLEGSLPHILALVVDAQGTGHAELEALGFNNVRIQFYGSVTLTLDRTLVSQLPVRTGLDLGTDFGGGVAVFSMNHHRLATQVLPPHYLAIPLKNLDQAGVFDQGQLSVHSISPTHKHHRLEMWAAANTLVVQARD